MDTRWVQQEGEKVLVGGIEEMHWKTWCITGSRGGSTGPVVEAGIKVEEEGVRCGIRLKIEDEGLLQLSVVISMTLLYRMKAMAGTCGPTSFCHCTQGEIDVSEMPLGQRVLGLMR
ncbi:hypothetical protein L2E82_53362 [Cichorium intybus]|nr:hypothetical protein L2E82_53732 [Cichorium intybus]KAI3671374.1 hypothetical protein L2E82_53362 [Cichorium intybus]